MCCESEHRCRKIGKVKNLQGTGFCEEAENLGEVESFLESVDYQINRRDRIPEQTSFT